MELVEDSSSHKSQSENFITKFAKVYTPAVCLGALALAIIPPAIQLMYGHADPQWENWIYRALIFLVISCPCALVISIPLSFFAGIDGASREGILIKGSNYMETLAQTRYIAFDKTGTLTKGNFEVNGVHHNQMEKEELLAYAAMAECASSHPISKSLQQAYGKPIDRNRVRNIHEISGHGVKAAVDGHIVAVGNDKLMKQMKILMCLVIAWEPFFTWRLMEDMRVISSYLMSSSLTHARPLQRLNETASSRPSC